MLQGCWKNVSCVLQGCFNKVERVFQACLKGVGKKYFLNALIFFHGRGVSNLLPGIVKVSQEYFEGISRKN